MQTIHYPVKGRKLEDIITQETLDMAVAHLENWQQGAGVFGRLNLHSCWGTVSVLDKGYQGETITAHARQMRIMRTLYEKTGNKKWLVTLNAMAAHLLYLQDKSGAFIHSTAEFEPTFDTAGCPIHFFYPIIALCEYYELDYVDQTIKELIPDAIERHWSFMVKNIWQIGNGNKRPLPFPGWCGVTNQDLIATAAVALCKKVFAQDEKYEQYGKPVLDYYLSENYYYKDIGLFERGDGHNFAERTVYYTHILDALDVIYRATGDIRCKQAYDNVLLHIFDAFFVGEDGLTYLARGAKTDANDKSKVYGWEYGSIAFEGYPELAMKLKAYLEEYPDEEKSRLVEGLRDTIATYIFADGTTPLGVFNPNPLFEISTNPDYNYWIEFIIDILGDKMVDPRPVRLPCIHRSYKNFTLKQNNELWAIEVDGERKYGGYSRFAGNLTVGPDANPIWGDFASLENPDFIEIID